MHACRLVQRTEPGAVTGDITSLFKSHRRLVLVPNLLPYKVPLGGNGSEP